MGRAERRRKERQKRIEERKGKFLMSPQDITEIKRKTLDNYDNFRTEAMFICFALVLHRLYGHGATRILRTWQAVDDLIGKMDREEVTLEEMKEMVEDEIKVKISFD